MPGEAETEGVTKAEFTLIDAVLDSAVTGVVAESVTLTYSENEPTFEASNV
jgi:hypothetical protein